MAGRDETEKIKKIKNTIFVLPNTHENRHKFTLKYVLGTVESLKTHPLLFLISGGQMDGQMGIIKQYVICAWRR